MKVKIILLYIKGEGFVFTSTFEQELYLCKLVLHNTVVGGLGAVFIQLHMELSRMYPKAEALRVHVQVCVHTIKLSVDKHFLENSIATHTVRVCRSAVVQARRSTVRGAYSRQ